MRGQLPHIEILELPLSIHFRCYSLSQDCKTIPTFNIFGMDCNVCRIYLVYRSQIVAWTYQSG